MRGQSGLHAAARHELDALLGERFTTAKPVREHHGRDESPLPPAPPDAVAFPTTTEEVAGVLRVCNRYRIPAIPFGAGSSLEGHVLATSGGVAIDLSGMDRIVSVNVDDLDATVEAGVTRKRLDERLRREGLFFPVDPGADATIGGMVATGASGTTTVGYGAMRTNVLSLEIVLAEGRVITSGGRAKKSSAGYDLTRLFLGSEGTLGVITQVTVRVYGLPEAISAVTCHFASLEDAVATVVATLQMGVPVARAELLDDDAIGAVNSFAGLDRPVAPTIFFEFHGSPGGVREQIDNVRDIAADNRMVGFDAAVDNAERERLWRARHEAFYASLALRPGARAITTDVCVPLSRLAECISDTKADVAETQLVSTIVGHVGDGNFHLMMLVDPDDDDEMKLAEEINERLVDRALEFGGTCTGEHGIGLHKIPFLRKEMGASVDAMIAIKHALDPLGILNPGKIFEFAGARS